MIYINDPNKRWVVPVDDSEGGPVEVLEGEAPSGHHTLIRVDDLRAPSLPDGWGMLLESGEQVEVIKLTVAREQEVI